MSEPGGLVHVIDDDAGVRDSLSLLFGSAGLEARTYASAQAFLDVLPGGVDGCVITDVQMPQLSGLELLRRLKSDGVALPVIVLTGQADVPMAVEALKNGAADFIEKPFDGEAILAAARGALQRLKARAVREDERAALAQRIAGLSPREREVLTGLVAGQSNKMIGLELGISPRTVEIYRANIMDKMRAQSLSELVRMSVLADL